MFELLLQCGASPHLPSDAEERISPLHAIFLTSRAGGGVRIEMLSQLLELGANPQACVGPACISAHPT